MYACHYSKNMIAVSRNLLVKIIKDTLKAFEDFRNKQKEFSFLFNKKHGLFDFKTWFLAKLK